MPARTPAPGTVRRPRPYSSFVVRLTPPHAVQSGPALKGNVRHVQSGLEASFVGFPELESFMRDVLTSSSSEEARFPHGERGPNRKEG